MSYSTKQQQAVLQYLEQCSEEPISAAALAEQLRPELERIQQGPLPAIIPIPGVSGNTGMGIANVKKFVEQAVGSDIIFNGD